MSKVSFFPGDNRETLRRLIDEGVRVHSVVTDPPYGLVSITKRFSKVSADDETKTSERIRSRSDGFGRIAAGGFLGKAWDATGIERDPEFWRLIWEILLPGGYLVSFSSSRTYHHMACAIEDAGFITHPMIGWLNGQGFPKAHNASKAIDKMLGVSGDFVPSGETVRRMIPGADQHREGSWIKDNGRDYQPGQYVPGSKEGAQWEGWAYGGQVRKPALEPIYVGQKPFSEKSGAANLLKHGVGAVNVDGCRIPFRADEDGRWGTGTRPGGFVATGAAKGSPEPNGRRNDLGRHPANLIHDGSPEVMALFPDSKGQQGAVRGDEPSRVTKEIYGEFPSRVQAPLRGDSGTAARFFECYPFEDRPAFYFPKAGKEDRAGSLHATVKPIALMQALIRHVTPPGGVVLDPFAGSGTTAEAAKREGFDCILMEAEDEYVDFLRKRFVAITEGDEGGFKVEFKSESQVEGDREELDSELERLLG